MDSGSLQRQRNRDTIRVQEGRAICPFCGHKTKQRILPDTVLENFPLFCGWCRTTTIVSYRSVPEPKSQSRR
ncbi:MAG: conjugal transfer protein [Clostridia bacterium]|nr:conjugal transfer protein [Clostridia bacterium]